MAAARILEKESREISRWVTLVAKTIEHVPGGESQIYHSLAQSDYINILALTPDGRIPLVRQYRPAVERVTLELPGGLLDSQESPSAVAARELTEEAGLAVSGEPVLLAKLLPDSGRLENRFWCFFAKATPLPDWKPEPGIDRVFYTAGELRQAILGGSFDHALHVALIGIAQMRGHLTWQSVREASER